MSNWRLLLPALAVAGFLALASLAGFFRPLDATFADWRFGTPERPARADIVFLEIDPASLETVGVWPWPREVHALILDQLMAMGAAEVAFDIDFSVPSTPASDAAFAAALERAGGFAALAAFRQLDGAGGSLVATLPQPEFRQWAPVFAVNVSTTTGGIVREYPLAVEIGEAVIPSLAAMLAGWSRPHEARFRIDYEIDAGTIDRVSVADLLAGTVDPARIADRKIVIGASAVELRDQFGTPNQGVIPGALLQILAAETLVQNRLLAPVGPLAQLLGLLLVAFGFAASARRFDYRLVCLAAAGLAVALEAIAWWLQLERALLLETAALQVALLAAGLGALGLDVQVRRFLHERMRGERDHIRGILDRVVADNFDGIVVVDGTGRIAAASRFAERFLGWPPGKRQTVTALPVPLRRPVEALLEGADLPAAGLLLARLPPLSPAGSEREVEFTVTVSEIDRHGIAERVACLTFRDVTEREAQARRIAFLAGHDPLTGALTRTAFLDRVERLLEDGRRTRHHVVCTLNLRRFATVNDAFGHDTGDWLLGAVVERLRALGADSVCRLGGDDFAFLLLTDTPEAAASHPSAVMTAMAAPYALPPHRIHVGCGLGTAVLADGDAAADLLRHAQMALAAAVRLPGNRCTAYGPALAQRVRDTQKLESELRHAIANGEIVAHYQPQVDLRSGRAIGAEALARWEHPLRGRVSPAQFIPVAEETGLIVELGRAVLLQACQAAATWPAGRVAVNVSPLQFELTDVAAVVGDALEQSGLPAGRLEIEVTESVLIDNRDVIFDALASLRQMGVTVALDDFGTGYSSLSYISQLPIDLIKIDQSFVRRLQRDNSALAILRAIIDMAGAVGKATLAEGIETAAQHRLLIDAGCELGQGYLFAPPLTLPEFAPMLRQPTLLAPMPDAGGTAAPDVRQAVAG